MSPEYPPPEVINKASEALRYPATSLILRPISGGLINRSYKLTAGDKSPVFLQAVNCSVFPKPDDLQYNYQLLYKHSQNADSELRIPALLFFENETSIYYEHDGTPWRMMEWIPGTETIEKLSSPDQAAAVARVFAQFTLSFNKDFDPVELRETLPHFHDLAFRFSQFEGALSCSIPERRKQAEAIITELMARKRYVDLFMRIKDQNSDFPLRVMHHDAKISNILFNADSGEPWGPIDLDTVMPGYFFSDLGDMIRSMATSANESKTEKKDISILDNYYRSIMDTYTSTMRSNWTDAEYEARHGAGLLIVYMQTLRFLTDYLSGDQYYSISYPQQNYDRAINQLTLLQKLEDYLNISFQFSV